MDGEEVVLKAVHHHPTSKRAPKIQDKDGTIGQTSFLDVIKLKIGAKAIIIHNVDVVDGVTNGQIGTIRDLIYTKSGSVDKIVFKPHDASIGHNNRLHFYSFFKCILSAHVLKLYHTCASTLLHLFICEANILSLYIACAAKVL